MGRKNRQALQAKLAAVYQHLDKSALFCAELYPIFSQSDPRLGEMLQCIAEAAIDAQIMLLALWHEMWGPPPEIIHPDAI